MELHWGELLVEAGLQLCGWAAGAAIIIAILRVRVLSLEKRQDRVEGKLDHLPTDFVPRSEVLAMLDGIKSVAEHTRDMIRAFLYGHGRLQELEAAGAPFEGALEMPAAYGPEGLALTEASEELRLLAYTDSGGVWTVGWGHTGKDVHKGMTITREMAVQLLEHDVATAVAAVRRFVKVSLNQHQFDALVDWTFNVGVGRLLGSTLLLKLNAGDYGSAAANFGLWVHDNGQILPGLVTRRRLEAALFLKPVTAQEPT